MTKNITRIPICDGVTFHSIGEKRFKTGRLTAAMLLPLSAETASANAVLPYLLRRSCRRYPTFRALNEKLSSLYGASLQAQVYKLGGGSGAGSLRGGAGRPLRPGKGGGSRRAGGAFVFYLIRPGL
ncbi:MAG: hypothetical protein ACLT1K_11940 [[Clostridium] leptum]